MTPHPHLFRPPDLSGVLCAGRGDSGFDCSDMEWGVIYFPPIVENSHVPIKRISGAKRTRLFEGLVKERGLICHWCGKRVVRMKSGQSRPANNTATLDHLVSRIFGGSDTRANCFIACWKCNHDRGLVDGFLSSLSLFHRSAPNRLFGSVIKNGEAM